MSSIEIIFGIILILFSVAIVAVVLFQEGHQQNLGAISGVNNDTFLSKNRARSIDAFLERWTKFIAIGFFLVVILINAIMFFNVFGA